MSNEARQGWGNNIGLISMLYTLRSFIRESVQKVGQYWRECYLEGGQPPGNYLAILEGEAIIALWPVMHPIASKWCGKVQ